MPRPRLFRVSILVRRALAIVLVPFAAAALGVTLLLTHADRTVLNGDHLASELRDAGIYTDAEEQLYPLLAARLLERVEEQLAIEAGTLSDDATVSRLAALIGDAFPAEYVEANTTAVLSGAVPYLRGERDGFEVQPQLGQRLDAALGHAPGQRSPLVAEMVDLDIGTRVMANLIAENAGALTAAQAGGSAVPDASDAGAWLTTSVADAIDELLPYLLGERDDFLVHVSVDGVEPLAPTIAGILGTTQEALLTRGYNLDSRALHADLGGDAEGAADLDRMREVLADGWVLDASELFNEGLQDDGGTAGAGTNELRDGISLAVGLVRWVTLLAMIGLLAAIGFLGGRRWPTRIAWGSAALLTSALLIAASVGVAWNALGQPRLHEGLSEATTGWDASLAPYRAELLADVEQLASNFVGGYILSAVLVAAFAAVAVVASTVWAKRSGEERDQSGETLTTEKMTELADVEEERLAA